MIWVEITTLLRVRDLCCHGYKHLVKFRVKNDGCGQKKNNDCLLETENKLLSPVLKSDVLLSNPVCTTPPCTVFVAL